MTDKMIRRFQIAGQTRETHLAQNRMTAYHHLVGSMRDQGYVPVLDLSPHYTLNMISDEVYDFKLTLHGVYVGEDAARVDGVSDGRLIWKFTQTNKSEESSKNSEST